MHFLELCIALENNKICVQKKFILIGQIFLFNEKSVRWESIFLNEWNERLKLFNFWGIYVSYW